MKVAVIGTDMKVLEALSPLREGLAEDGVEISTEFPATVEDLAHFDVLIITITRDTIQDVCDLLAESAKLGKPVHAYWTDDSCQCGLCSLVRAIVAESGGRVINTDQDVLDVVGLS